MNALEAGHVLVNAIATINQAGFLCTGEITYCVPKHPELCDQDCKIVVGEASRVELKAQPNELSSTLNVSSSVAPRENPKSTFGDYVPPVESKEGAICSCCGGGRFRKTGTCSVCLDCGESGGCS